MVWSLRDAGNVFVETLQGKANREPSLLAQSRLSLPGQVS
jgi:hypothetical protein